MLNRTLVSDSSATDLLKTAFGLQKNILLPLLAPDGVVFLFGVVLVAQFKRHVKKNVLAGGSGKWTIRYKTYAQVLLWLSTGIVWASTMGIVQGTATLQYFTALNLDSKIVVHAGIALQVLQLLILSFSAFFALGINLIIDNSAAGSIPKSLPLASSTTAAAAARHIVRPQRSPCIRLTSIVRRWQIS